MIELFLFNFPNFNESMLEYKNISITWRKNENEQLYYKYI